ncbi:hypothetical protein [Paenibacillus sp. OAS669]|uniref:hypothetical protein n=1 Tax=Paenibacillus sp. OAS669 TaxID=2663821 RepID=UPI001788F470|nr:hypothetical protein [Paenibacillus sp. OAS669]MBE1443659.1 hypothetical protein [Paenibacillus sp. OAS669]
MRLLPYSLLCFAVAVICAVISVLSLEKEGSGFLTPFLVPSVIVGFIGALARVPLLLYISFLLAAPLLLFVISMEFWFIAAVPACLLLSAVMLHLPRKKPVPSR